MTVKMPTSLMLLAFQQALEELRRSHPRERRTKMTKKNTTKKKTNKKASKKAKKTTK
jgi:hypothetical protein